MSLNTILSSWYPLVRSIDLKKGKTTTLEVLGHWLVLFRTSNNQVGVLSRQCPHMGGDLSKGSVSKTGLICPIHHWEFDHNGHRTGQCKTPGKAASICQASVPCIERLGLIFAFLGNEPYFDFPDIAAPIYRATPAVSDMDMHYTVPSLFGFDTEHFTTVHHREQVEITLYHHQPGHIGMRLKAQVGFTRWSDRLMRKLGINEVENDIDYWAGNIVIGRHIKTRTHALITTLPLAEHHCRVFFVSMQEKPEGKWIKHAIGWCRFQMAKPLIKAFVRQDEQALNGVRFNANTSKHRQNNVITDWLDHADKLPSVATTDLLK